MQGGSPGELGRGGAAPAMTEKSRSLASLGMTLFIFADDNLVVG
jgi:hypothetical protein